MADIKMCNKCGEFFGTSEEGWSHWNGKIHGRYDDGTIREVAEQFDFCTRCTGSMTRTTPHPPQPPTQRAMLDAGYAAARIYGDYTADDVMTATEARRRGYSPDYVAWLEREAAKPLSEVIREAEEDAEGGKVHLCDHPMIGGRCVRIPHQTGPHSVNHEYAIQLDLEAGQ